MYVVYTDIVIIVMFLQNICCTVLNTFLVANILLEFVLIKIDNLDILNFVSCKFINTNFVSNATLLTKNF